MNEQDFVGKVAWHLNAGLDALPPSVLQGLQAARHAALARAAGRQPADGLAQSPARAGTLTWRFNRRLLAPAAVLLAVLGLLFWQQQAREVGPTSQADFAEVDAEVLTDDLPVVAYLDPGFEIWLYHQPPAAGQPRPSSSD